MMLTDLADACRKSGLPVVELDGWRGRTRPASTGSFNPRGILCHHTGPGVTGLAGAKWMANVGRADLPAPLCQLSLGRDGTVYVCAAGRANHAGTAKTSGPLPAGDGNSLYIGIEAQNTGTEGWTDTQRTAYARLCAALCSHYDWPSSHVRAHKETSVTGKWDPGALDMTAFRNEVAALIDNPEPKDWFDMAEKADLREVVDNALQASVADIVAAEVKKQIPAIAQAAAKEVLASKITQNTPSGDSSRVSLATLLRYISLRGQRVEQQLAAQGEQDSGKATGA